MGLTQHSGIWIGEPPVVSDDVVDSYACGGHLIIYLRGRGEIVTTVPFGGIKGVQINISWNIKSG